MAGRRIITLVLAGIMIAALSLPLYGYTDEPAGVQVMLGLGAENQGQAELADAQQAIKEIQARFEAIGMSKPKAEQRGGKLIRITLPDPVNIHKLEEVLGILAFEFKEKYQDETVFAGGDIAEVLLQLDPVSSKPVVHVRFHTGHAGSAGMQKKSLAVYVTDYSPITQTLKPAEPGKYTIEGFKDLAEARRVAALLYDASCPLNVKILDTVRQTGAAESSAAAAGVAATKHPFLDRADRYAAFYNPFRCRELFDLCNLIRISPFSPNAGQQVGLTTRLRSYVGGDDIHGTLSGSRLLSILKWDSTVAAASGRQGTTKTKKPNNNKSSLMHIGYAQENRIEEYLSYYVAGAMVSKPRQSFEYNNRQTNIIIDYCYYDQKQQIGYLGGIFCNTLTGLAWSPAQGQMGKTVVFRIHNPQLTAVTAENLHQFDDFMAKRFPGAASGDNNIKEKLMKYTNSDFLLPSNNTGLFDNDRYTFFFPVDVGDFSLEQALSENGFSADSVIFVDLN